MLLQQLLVEVFSYLSLHPFSDFPVHPYGGILPRVFGKPPHAPSNPSYLLIFYPAPSHRALYPLCRVLHSLSLILWLEAIPHLCLSPQPCQTNAGPVSQSILPSPLAVQASWWAEGRESRVLLQGRASKHSHHVSQPTRIQRRSCKQSLNSQRETLRGPSASLPCVCAVHGRAEPRSKRTGATELVSVR